MPKRIIISDTSSLIALTNIGELEILKSVYEEVVITPEIAEEYGLEAPDWIRIESANDEQKFKLLNLELDKGESSGIALALENESSLLIIDEKKGRGIAKKLGIKITGILGVMIKAKETGLVDQIKPLIQKLEKVDFRISAKLKTQILEKVGE
jgi:predicted nucleic acid-binding protein